MDWFGPDVGMSNAKAGGSSSVAFIVGIVIGLFGSFGFFVVLQLFSQCWDFFGDQSCMLESLEMLWVDFVRQWVLVCFRFLCSCSVNVGTFLVIGPACWRAWKCCGQILSGGRFLFVSVIVVSSDSLLWTPEGTTLKHALVWMLSAFGCFSCWFGLRCTRNCRFPLVAQMSSASGCGKKFPVSTDILGSFCSVGNSLLDLSSHMLQVNCGWFPPAGLFNEFWNLVLHSSVSS